MSKRDYKLTLGNIRIEGKWALILGIIILIPVLCLVGVILSLVFTLISTIIGGTFSLVGGVFSILGTVFKFIFSIVKLVLSFSFGAIAIAILIGIIALFLPSRWRKKLGMHTSFTYTHSSKSRQKKHASSDDDQVIDVDYTEEDE